MHQERYRAGEEGEARFGASGSERQRRGPSPGVLSFDARAVRSLLPQRYPFMLLDRVQAYYALEKKLIGIKQISRNEPFIQGHFPDYPMFPGALIIESLAQASACLMIFDDLLEQGTPVEQLPEVVKTAVAAKSFLAESRIRHLKPVYPGVQVVLECQLVLKSGDRYSFKTCAWVDGEEVTKGQITLARSLARRDPRD